MTTETHALPDDLVLPFQVDSLDLRGRLVRLGALIDTVLSRHDYPPAVSRALGEVILIAGLVGNALKFDGTFTVQTKGDGPLSMIVADFATPGALRGFAQFDAEAVARLGPRPSMAALMGKGYLALTIDQGPQTDRYQGIVPLEGPSLAAAAEGYFRTSEQVPTTLVLAVEKLGGRWRAGGVLVQLLPAQSRLTTPAEQQEHWDRGAALVGTTSAHELTDPDLAPEQLLWRLFHEDGARVSPALPLAVGCRCSRERIATVLDAFTPEEREDMTVDGRIVVTCEFCSAAFAFPQAA
ncbi:Hsp33 family molecular chaperone [Zavarzinia sp. CC-PAN008]|uniref:Hsp33 family molecular chaperone n=1 Tax=Zavarzinia sp. CC-PAN008 TaxID=3243332 RepID=UPI003F74610D